MSDQDQRVAARPVLAGIRRILLAFVLLTVVVELLEWVDAGTALWPDRAVAAAALLVAPLWALLTYRSGRPRLWADVAVLASVVVVAWGLGRDGAVLGLLIGLAVYRPLFGSRVTVATFGVGLIAAHVTAVWMNGEFGDVLTVATATIWTGTTALLVAFGAIAEALARHDRALAWDAVVTRAATDLVPASSPDDVHDVLARGLAGLVADLEGGYGVVWRGNGVDIARVRSVGAPPPHPTGTSAASALDDDRRAHLRAGAPLVVTGADAVDLSQRAGARANQAGYHVVPLRWRGVIHGVVVIGAPDEPPTDLLPYVQRLAADASLALERLETEERFRQLADDNRDGVYVLQLAPTLRVLYVNDALLDLLGYERDALLRDPDLVEAVLHPDDRERLRRQRAGGGDERPAEVRLRHADGRWLRAELRELLVGAADRATVVQGQVRDVTAERQREEALQRALADEEAAAAELRRLNELKSAFLAGVSHELRTPLTALVGYSQTLSDRAELLEGDQGGLMIDAIHRNALRLQRLLSDLLDVDRLSRGVVEPNLGATDLTALARQVLAEVEAPGHVVTLAAAEPLVVDVDGPKVERIVENLVRNAVKHTPRGTQITVSVRPEDDAAVIVVEDDGPGIPERLRQTLFEPFRQGPEAGRGPSPGTGIGLHLVQQFAELHGGSVRIGESAHGGARFTVRLPAAPERSAGGPGPRGDGRTLVS